MTVQVAQKGDIGTAIRLTITKQSDGTVLDISTASTKQIILRSPAGKVKTFTATLVTDGTDGKMEYITAAAADLDEAGKWDVQGRVVIASSNRKTILPVQFEVKANL
jgi:hypothetical protein